MGRTGGAGNENAPATSATGRVDVHRGSWHRRATRPIMWWILALVVLGIVHRWVPASSWVIIHIFTLGLLANSIHVWSQHFVEAILKARQDDAFRVRQTQRIYLFNIGILVLVAGMIGSWLPVVYIGSTIVFAGALWHAIVLTLQIRTAKQSRFRRVIAFYAPAAFLLPVGAVLGALSATTMLAGTAVLAPHWPERLLLAHVAVNILGFVGLTVHVTLVTFWPVVLRTRMVEGQDTAGYLGLWAMLGGSAVLATGALTGVGWLATAGIVIYLFAVLAVCWYLVRTAVRTPPREFPAMSMGVAMVWWVVALAWLAWLLATSGGASIRDVTVPLLAGFAGQLLFGAMAFLMPTVMRGGPRAVRAGMIGMNRLATFRLVLINGGLVIYLWPGVSSWLLVVGSTLAFVGYVLFVPILVLAVRAQLAVIRAKNDGPGTSSGGARERPGPGTDVPIAPGRQRNLIGALSGALVLVLAVGATLVADPASPLRGGVDTTAQVTPTGETTTVEVSAVGMRFEPSSVDVPAGDRLVIELRNDDETNIHDLYLPSGIDSGRLAPGESTTVDAGVIGESMEGWCTIAGHQAMGMTFDVNVIGDDPAAAGVEGIGGAGAASDVPAIDFSAPPGEGMEVHDPRLAPAPDRDVHELTITVEEEMREIAPGVTRPVWTYNGGQPGPTLRGNVGDEFVVTFRNEGTMGHSIDFHAGDVSPDEVMRTIPPGEELEYRFTARRSGAWLYHCGTAPMSGHVAAGMFGAVIIDPPELPEVDHEYLVVQSESYLGGSDEPFDMGKIGAGQPDIVMFNGHATQYRHEPLRAAVGERVRVWVVVAGPNDGTSFHVVGSLYDTVFKEGAYRLRPDNPEQGGAQALDLAPAQGGFVEMEFREPGRYTMVDHSFRDAEMGATGFIDVSG